jgi:uncharacterized protein involved in exopolysaccharide biosynthesis
LKPFNLLDAVGFLRSRGRRFALWGIGLAVAGYLVSFLIPSVYQATAVILPPDEDDLTAALSFARRGVSGIPALGRLGGGTYFTQADVALATLRSQSVHESVVREFDLVRVYKAKTREDAVRTLRDKTTIRIGSDGTISVSAWDRSAIRAAGIANAFFDNLDEFNRTFRTSRARRTREFLERRVAETDSLLRDAELKLAAYQGRKGAMVLSPETRAAADAAVSLMSQKLAAEVDLQIMRSYASPNSEELQRLEARVRELGRQIGGLPATQIGGAELVRQVVVRQQMFALLTNQLEEARIREVMDTPTIQVLDRATPPERRVWPKRLLIAAFGFVLGLGVAIVASSRSRAVPA